MQLPSDDAFLWELWEAVIHRGHAIHLDGDMLPDATDVVLVELAFFHDSVGNFPGGLFHHSARAFPVEATPVALADVALRATHDVVVQVDQHAANLHATVPRPPLTAEPHLKAQLEILVCLPAAQKRIGPPLLQPTAALNVAVFHGPELLEAMPV